MKKKFIATALMASMCVIQFSAYGKSEKPEKTESTELISETAASEMLKEITAELETKMTEDAADNQANADFVLLPNNGEIIKVPFGMMIDRKNIKLCDISLPFEYITSGYTADDREEDEYIEEAERLYAFLRKFCIKTLFVI